MIRLILLSDFTESFSYNLLKGVLMYANSHEPWVVCRMPLSYKQTYGIKGVLKWAKTWHADAIIGRFDNDDNVEIFRENGKNGVDCYSKNGHAVTVLTRQS